MLASTVSFLALVAAAQAHTAAWAPGMYCRGGNNTAVDDQNTNLAVNPIYQLSKQDWWFQHDRGCDKAPPPEGEFLELPAGGSFTVEHAHNRAQTTLSYGGQFTSEWPDGQQHPEDWNGLAADPSEGCIQDDGALHVQNQTSATGTVFAISYQSDLSKVTMENLAVFTVLEHTPWKRVATYQVPDLPACPPGGCTCAWGWVPKGCGIPNMYFQGFKCNVTGATSTTPVAPAQPPVYCGDDATKCVQGAKQMIIWHQAEGNNVSPPNGVSPGYNAGMGFLPGAQTNIFVTGASTSSASASAKTSSPAASSTSSSAKTSSTVSSSTSSSANASSYVSPSTSSKVSSTISASSTPVSPIVKIPSITSSSFKASATPSSSSGPHHSPSKSGTPLSTTSIPVKVVTSSTSSYSAPTTFSTLATPSLTSAIYTNTSSPSSSSSSTTSAAASSSATDAEFQKFKEYMDGAWNRWWSSHGN